MENREGSFCRQEVQHGVRISDPITLEKSSSNLHTLYLIDKMPHFQFFNIWGEIISLAHSKRLDNPPVLHYPQDKAIRQSVTYPLKTILTSDTARKLLKLICLSVSRQKLGTDNPKSSYKFTSISAFTKNGKMGARDWAGTDLCNIVYELSFQFGLSLNSKSMCSVSLLVDALALRKTSPLGNEHFKKRKKKSSCNGSSKSMSPGFQ